jgi:hypothetical protein
MICSLTRTSDLPKWKYFVLCTDEEISLRDRTIQQKVDDKTKLISHGPQYFMDGSSGCLQMVESVGIC